MTTRPVTGVVLAAGASSRLGTPKQLLPYGDTTLLGACLDVARSCGFDQIIVTLGGSADAVRTAVPLNDVPSVSPDATMDPLSESASLTLAEPVSVARYARQYRGRGSSQSSDDPLQLSASFAVHPGVEPESMM